MLSVKEIRDDFPILSTTVNGRPLIYLDNAATTQVPVCVLDRIKAHYQLDHANVHRGVHTLSVRSTEAYEAARETVQKFLGAGDPQEIVFTQGTTDSINMVAEGIRHELTEDDCIIVTELEHHSNFITWQRLCERTGAAFRIVPCPSGSPDMEAFRNLLEYKPKLVAVTQVSNLTGTVMPLEEMTKLAHDAGSKILVDGAQGIRHFDQSMAEADYDFYCFSGHKVMAPTGIGVLYGKAECLERLEPFRVGGGMVDAVQERSFTTAPLPARLEAGTPNIVGAIALAEALSYIDRIGRRAIGQYEEDLLRYAEQLLAQREEIRILGNPEKRAGVLSFVVSGIHSYDIASVIDKMGVAIRSGTHCAQPALHRFQLADALRLSPAFYNTFEEIETACICLDMTQEMIRKWTGS